METLHTEASSNRSAVNANEQKPDMGAFVLYWLAVTDNMPEVSLSWQSYFKL